MISTTTTIVVMWLVVPVLCKVNRIYITRSILGVRSIDRSIHTPNNGRQRVCFCNTCGHVYGNISMNEPAHKRITHHHHWITNRTEKIVLVFIPPPSSRTGTQYGRNQGSLRTRNVQGRVQEEQPRSCYMYLYYI